MTKAKTTKANATKTKVAKVKAIKLKPFEKLLTVMVSGKPVTKEEIESTLGKEIYMYRLSTYMWHIKTIVNGSIKAIKSGRKVTAYQLMNPKDMVLHMKSVGAVEGMFSHKVEKLADLQSEPVVAEDVAPVVTPVVETETDDVQEIL
jgi:hypothetical protein